MISCLATAILVSGLAVSGSAEPSQAFWTLSGGGGAVFEKNLQDGRKTQMTALLLHPGYRSENWNFALDAQLRWDLSERTFLQEEWKREGDWLRPIDEAYGSLPKGLGRAGLRRLNRETVGSGQLVRGLVGTAEVDYALPGLFANAEFGPASLEFLADRPVSTSVMAGALTWRVHERISLAVEGAVDPGAPHNFSDPIVFENGRPVADTKERVSGMAGQAVVLLVDGRVLDASVFATMGRLSKSARGQGRGLELSLDFSDYYTSRLSLKATVTDCERGYLPSYFEGIYPVARWGFEGKPWLESHPLGEDGASGRMDALEISYVLGEYFLVRAGYESFDDEQIRRARFALELLEENGKGLEVFAWSRSEGPDQKLFDKDQNLFAQVSALYNFFSHVLLRVSYLHSWKFIEGEGGLVPYSSLLMGGEYTITF